MTKIKPQQIYLESNYIPNPSTSHTYYLKSDVVPDGKVKITFHGEGINDFILFDASTLSVRSKKHSNKFVNLHIPGNFFIVRDALPLH
jgi:hypothetical protein